MRKGYLLLGIALLVMGCRTTKEMNRTEVETVRCIKEIVRDIMVIVSSDSSWLRAWLACDSTGQVIMKELIDYRAGKKISVPQVEIKNNLLTAKATVDSFGIFMTLRDKYENNTMSQLTTIERVKEIYRLRTWQKWILLWGIVSLLIYLRKLWNLFGI